MPRNPHNPLYRSTPPEGYTGPGSFWAESLQIARRYGRPGEVHVLPTPTERVLYLNHPEQIVEVLVAAGVDPQEAEEMYWDNDWMDYDSIRSQIAETFDWVRQPLNGTQYEWIRL